MARGGARLRHAALHIFVITTTNSQFWWLSEKGRKLWVSKRPYRKPNLFSQNGKLLKKKKKSAWTNIFMITEYAVLPQPYFHYWFRIGEYLARGCSKKFYQGEAPLLLGSTPYPFLTGEVPVCYTFYWQMAAPFTYLIYNFRSFSTAVNVLSLNMMNKSQNQNVSSTSSKPQNESVSPLKNFYRPKWQISLPFHIL